MAPCTVCDRDMLAGKPCVWRPQLVVEGLLRHRIPQPDPATRWDRVLQWLRLRAWPAACHDCGTPPGGLHHAGCDAERCPACHGQAISCGCQWEGDDVDPSTCQCRHPEHGDRRCMDSARSGACNHCRLNHVGPPGPRIPPEVALSVLALLAPGPTPATGASGLTAGTHMWVRAGAIYHQDGEEYPAPLAVGAVVVVEVPDPDGDGDVYVADLENPYHATAVDPAYLASTPPGAAT